MRKKIEEKLSKLSTCLEQRIRGSNNYIIHIDHGSK